MDAATKKKLIDKLADARNFDKLYPNESRRWFVDRLVRTYEAQNIGDAQITTNVTDVVTKSKAIVKAKRDFAIGLKFGRSLEKIQAGRRIEILYGAIASDPDFVDPANSAVLDWVAKRRLRSVSRMDFFVNPNSQGYFRYPKTCKTNQIWRVNVNAAAHWQPSPPPPKPWPILLKRPAGGPDYVKAINSIFKSKKDPCEGNLLDCAVTLGAVFLDSLMEAKDPPNFLKKVDSRIQTNLAIHHADGSLGPIFNMLTDQGPEGLFVTGSTLVYDLQVGDHVYIFNHPLYRVFEPDGYWRGEHSVVYNAGDRQARSRKGIFFGGHGKEGTVYKFYDDFLTEVQTHLHRAFRISAIFLAWMQTGGASLPANRVSETSGTWAEGGVTDPVTFYEFDVTFKYNDYTKAPTKGRPRPTKTEQKFVIWHFYTRDFFLIDKLKSIAAVLQANRYTEPIRFERTNTAGSDEFNPLDWAIAYPDQSTGTMKFFSPFQRQRGKLAFKPLTIDALFESPFAKRDPNKEEISTTKPRASLTAQYRSFLSTNGAI